MAPAQQSDWQDLVRGCVSASGCEAEWPGRTGLFLSLLGRAGLAHGRDQRGGVEGAEGESVDWHR